MPIDSRAPDDLSTNWGFTALMIFCPKEHHEEFYRILLQNTECYDGDLFARLWFHIHTSPAHQIPAIYMQPYSPDLDTGIFWQNVKILHFCDYPKPWMPYVNYHSADWYMSYYLSQIKEIKLALR